MKQILQSLRTGATEVADVPTPSVKAGHLLIETSRTLVSSGTERMMVEFGKAGWIEKARQQPDKVAMVLAKVRNDGLQPTLEAVRNKLDQPLPLGYCNAGVVIGIGAGVTGYEVGDRIISNSKHAEVVVAPVNLCAKVPEKVSDDEAAFTVLGAVALQGIRLVQPTLGEAVVVIGLGLVGLLTVQLLRAHGCRVLGIDFDPAKLKMAQDFGAEVVNPAAGEDPILAAQAFSRERGVDAVLVTAATRSSEPIHQAATMCRKRGRIVLVGVTGLELSRDDFFKKELTFQVSASYGPGRYDPEYEEKGHDYPVGFVRWTEQRNFEAVLDMMAEGRLDVKPLVSHSFDIAAAHEAYSLIAGSAPSMGVLLKYPGLMVTSESRTVSLFPHAVAAATPADESAPKVSFVGSGNYATGVLIPAFQSAGARLGTVACSSGVTGFHAGRKFGFQETTTDVGRVFSDPSCTAVVISTRHDSHADFVLKALDAGKPVFVEKPLCLTLAELRAIEDKLRSGMRNQAGPILTVGFNRRFAPQVRKMKELLAGVSGPKCFVFTVNAGAIPPDHWTHDPATGGGRILGEACHFIDLVRFLAGARISRWQRMTADTATRDSVTLQLAMEDGSIGTIHYFANGNKGFPKERLEVFAAGKVLVLDNFRKLRGFGWPGFSSLNLWRQDKGQRACVQAFLDALREGKPAPIPLEELLEVSRLSIELAEDRA